MVHHALIDSQLHESNELLRHTVLAGLRLRTAEVQRRLVPGLRQWQLCQGQSHGPLRTQRSMCHGDAGSDDFSIILYDFLDVLYDFV